MHEMALCTEVVNVVETTAQEAGAIKVNNISMVIGEMRDIIIDLFDGFFHYLTKDTIAEDASVIFTTMPATLRCHECGCVFPVDLHATDVVSCPTCDCHDYELATGNEFFIESIDITTADEAKAACHNEK